MIHSLIAKIGSALLSLGILFGAVVPVAAPSFGSVNPVGGVSYSLAGAGINSTQATIPLASFTTPDGRPLTMSMFGTLGYGALEPQTAAKLEDVTFSGIVQNANGTATLTGVTRGNDFVTPYAASTTLAHSHAGGATFILTNTAGFYTQFAAVNNAQTISGVWTFASTSAPQYDAAYNASGNQLVSFAQLNGVVIQGAGTSTESALGLVQLANASQTGAGTASSSAGAPLVIENKFATTTPGVLCTGGSWKCLVAATNGKISHAWLDLTAAFSFSGGLTSTATTTIEGSNVNSNALIINSLAYALPAVRAASSTVLMENGAGSLSFELPQVSTLAIAGLSTSNNSSTTTLQVTKIPANTINANTLIRVYSSQVSGGSNCFGTLDFGTGSATTSTAYFILNGQFDTTLYLSNGTTGAYWVSDTVKTSSATNNLAQSSFATTSPLYVAVAVRSQSSAVCSSVAYTVEELHQ